MPAIVLAGVIVRVISESRRSTGELTTAVYPIHNPALKQGFANRVRVFDRGQPDCVNSFTS